MQFISKTNDADNGSTSSEADISRTNLSRRATAAEGRRGKVVLIPQDHRPQRRRLPRQAGKQAQ